MNLVSAVIPVTSAEPLAIESITADRTSAGIGDSIIWTAKATGGGAPLQYSYLVYRNGSIVHKVAYQSANTLTYTPAEAGSYKVKVMVKDASGTVVNLVSVVIKVS